MTEAEGIKLLEDAGYRVVFPKYCGDKDEGYYLYKNDKKIEYSSTRRWLTNQPFLIKNTIKKRAFNRGYDKGRAAVQNEIKNSLGIGE